jgi:glycosyltransferase involved in cell wall biosynthesis
MGTPRVNQACTRTKAVGVVIPVHNEEELLGAALAALDSAISEVEQLGIECHTAIVLDDCSDGSAAIARHWARALARRGGAHQAVILRCFSTGVGIARRMGCSALLRRWAALNPDTIWLATTDADSRVPPNWLATQVAAHEAGADLWTGRVTVEDWSPYSERTAVLWHEAYDNELVPIHGANLGCNARTYLDARGFSSLRTGEDRALHQAIVEAGGNAVEDLRTLVITSARRQARAPLGFAHALSSFDDTVRRGELIPLLSGGPMLPADHRSSWSVASGERIARVVDFLRLRFQSMMLPTPAIPTDVIKR